MKGKPGYAKKFGSGKCGDFNYLAIELLGPSISSLIEKYKTFTSKTVFKIGVQLIDRLMDLHAQNIVHADLKPGNITIGLEEQGVIHLIDFGLSQIIADADGRSSALNIGAIVGNFRYLGIGAHDGIVAFRNDLEAVGYLMVFLLKGDLPWNNETIKKTESLIEMANEIKDMKLSFFYQAQSPLNDLPVELRRYFNIIKNTAYIGRPNYHELRHALG